MKKIKVCKYCGRTFETDENARKFCRKRCAEAWTKKRPKKINEYTCQWCGKTFEFGRRKKFCSEECRSEYMSRLGLLRKTVKKVPVKITITDAVTGAKKENISYGRYVSIHKLR